MSQRKKPRPSKDHRLIVLVSSKQKDAMRERANAAELSLSSWARALLTREIEEGIPVT